MDEDDGRGLNQPRNIGRLTGSVFTWTRTGQLAQNLRPISLEVHMAQQIPVADVAGTFALETRVGWDLPKSMEPEGRATDVFVLSLSPAVVQQQLEDTWMEEALAELGLSDLVPHA